MDKGVSKNASVKKSGGTVLFSPSNTPTHCMKNEGPGSLDHRQRYFPDSSGSPVVLDILHSIAKQTVEKAITQHKEKGGKKVTAARVRIIPGSLRVRDDGKGDFQVPELVQKFSVFQSKDGKGEESSILEPVGPLLHHELCSPYDGTCVAARPSCRDGVYTQPVADCLSRSYSDPFSGHLHFGSSTATPEASSLNPEAVHSPSCQANGNYCSGLTRERGSSTPGFTSIGRHLTCLPPTPPYWVTGSQSNAVPSSHVDTQKFADACLDTYIDRTKLKGLSPDVKSLVKDILKVWTMKSHYEESARVVKAWITRHRCCYGGDATEELALKEIPQQYEKCRKLETAIEKLQRQLYPRLSSMILRPVQRFGINEQDMCREQSDQTVDELQKNPRKPLAGLQHLIRQVSKLNTIYKQLQLLAEKSHRMDRIAERKSPSTGSAPGNKVNVNMLQFQLHQLGAVLKTTTKACTLLTDQHDEGGKTIPKAVASGNVSPRALESESRNQELVKELQQLSEQLTTYKEMLRQAHESNQRQVSEIVGLKGRHRVLCRITAGVEFPGAQPFSAVVLGDYATSQGITRLQLKSQAHVQHYARSHVSSFRETRSFDFDRVYNEHATTMDIYSDMKELTDAVFCGNTLGIVVVGPPKSGKTTLLFSSSSNACGGKAARRDPNKEGLVVHFLSHLYALLKEKCMVAPQKGSRDAKISCTGVEIHNEVLLDAFAPQSRTCSTRPEVVKNARTGEVRVTNLRRVGGEITGDTVENLLSQNIMVDSILTELRDALDRRRAAARESHVVFTISFEVVDRDLGEHQTGKIVFAMIAASADPTLKPPFDTSASFRTLSSFGNFQDDATAATHLTNCALDSLRNILQARKSARGLALGDELFKGSRLTRILQDCFKPPALSVLFLTVRNDSLRLNMAQFYAEICGLARR